MHSIVFRSIVFKFQSEFLLILEILWLKGAQTHTFSWWIKYCTKGMQGGMIFLLEKKGSSFEAALFKEGKSTIISCSNWKEMDCCFLINARLIDTDRFLSHLIVLCHLQKIFSACLNIEFHVSKRS